MRAVTVDLTLGRTSSTSSTAELRITVPGSPAPITPLLVPAPVAIELAHLRTHALDLHAYGRTLSNMLFADRALRVAFTQARTVAVQQAAVLRLCLTIRPEADELHAVRWECLSDPDPPERPLAADGQVLLSRTLPSADWSALAPRPAGPLRAVALIAAPADLADYGLSPIDSAQEIAHIHVDLAGCATVTLGGDTRATLSALLGHLHTGCDLLFVLAHGRTDEQGQTWLYLEGNAGNAQPTPDASLVTRIATLAEKPRLIILAACESAGNGSGDTLAALGPQLVRAGVPAVLAMQSRISRETLGQFLPVCLQALIQNGQIDRAPLPTLPSASLLKPRPTSPLPSRSWRRSSTKSNSPGRAGTTASSSSSKTTVSAASTLWLSVLPTNGKWAVPRPRNTAPSSSSYGQEGICSGEEASAGALVVERGWRFPTRVAPITPAIRHPSVPVGTTAGRTLTDNHRRRFAARPVDRVLWWPSGNQTAVPTNECRAAGVNTCGSGRQVGH